MCESAWNADTVFVGEVVETTQTDTGTGVQDISGHKFVENPFRNRLRVLEPLTGKVTSGFVDVYTSGNTTSCPFNFSRGALYLVYAYEVENAGKLVTGMCTRTQLLADAGDDLFYLRGEARQRDVPSRVQGKVSRLVFENGVGRDDPFPGVRVHLASVDVKRPVHRESTTSADGRYSIPVPPGRYSVTVDIRDGLWVWPERSIVDLKPAPACTEADFDASPDGRISGRVVAPDGRAVPYLAVDIIRADETLDPVFVSRQHVLTGQDGSFLFRQMLPNTYFVGLEILENRLERRTIWLKTEDGSVSRPIPVAPEERVTIGDFRLPESIEIAEIFGRFVDAKGTPIAGANIHLFPGTCCGEVGALTAKDGTFRLSAVAGRSYELIGFSSERGYPVQTAKSSFVAVKGRMDLELKQK